MNAAKSCRFPLREAARMEQEYQQLQHEMVNVLSLDLSDEERMRLIRFRARRLRDASLAFSEAIAA